MTRDARALDAALDHRDARRRGMDLPARDANAKTGISIHDSHASATRVTPDLDHDAER